MGWKKVILKTCDGATFKVDESIVVQSETIRSMMEAGYEDNELLFPLPNVRSKVMEKVIEYCEKHAAAADSSSMMEEGLKKDLKEWDSKFISGFDTNVLYHLLLAANYLEVKGQLDLIIESVANLIKGKTPEQIRVTFNIKNDFTPEQETKIRKENPWAFEVPVPVPEPQIHKPNTTLEIQNKLHNLDI